MPNLTDRAARIARAAKLQPLEQLPAAERPTFAIGELALDRDGRRVRIVSIHVEDGVSFAGVVYVDGDGPDAGGRIGGTVDEPVHEAALYDRKALPAGGDYYVDADWIVELGLSKLPDERELKARELVAELELLERFDVVRHRAGHDYGSGQRHLELSRRRRELEQLDPLHTFAPATDAELVAAFDRVCRPRWQRAAAGVDKWGATPSARRTIEAWEKLGRADQHRRDAVRRAAKDAHVAELELDVPASDRELVVVGWDGGSRPMLRYADELELPESQRSIVSAADRARYDRGRRAEVTS